MQSGHILLSATKSQLDQKPENRLEQFTQWFTDIKGDIGALPSGRFLVSCGDRYIYIVNTVDNITTTEILKGRIRKGKITPDEKFIYTYTKDHIIGIEEEITCLDLKSSKSAPSFPTNEAFLDLGGTSSYPAPGMLDDNNFMLLAQYSKRLLFFSLNPFMKQFETPFGKAADHGRQGRIIPISQNQLLYCENHWFYRDTRLHDFVPEFIKNRYKKAKIYLFEIKDHELVALAKRTIKKKHFTAMKSLSNTTAFSTHVDAVLEDKGDGYLRMWKIENSTLKKAYTIKFENMPLHGLALLPDNKTFILFSHSKKQFCTFNLDTKNIIFYPFENPIYQVAITSSGLVGFMTDKGMAVMPFEAFMADYLNNLRDVLKNYLLDTKEFSPADIVVSYVASHPSALFTLKKIPHALMKQESKNEMTETEPSDSPKSTL